jgi:integrase
MDAVIEPASGWQRRLYFLLRCTGLRVGKALELRWDDLRFEQGIAEIRPELGKSKQERRGPWIPLAQVLVAELAGWACAKATSSRAGERSGSPALGMLIGRGSGPGWTRQSGRAALTTPSALDSRAA